MNVECANFNVFISMYFPVCDFEKPSKEPLNKWEKYGFTKALSEYKV
jgi:hypothetical protein